MKIGIVCTLRAESARVFDELLESNWSVNTAFHCEHMDFYSGFIGEHTVVLGWCPSGKVSTALCSQALIFSYGVDVVFSLGAASSLTGKLDRGTLFVASSVIQFDVDTTALGNPHGWVSGSDCVDFFQDFEWVCAFQSFARGRGIDVERGSLVSGDRFISDGKTKRLLRSRFSAIASDMDSAGVVQACEFHRVPSLVLRVISDHCDGIEYIEYHTLVLGFMFDIVIEFIKKLESVGRSFDVVPSGS